MSYFNYFLNCFTQFCVFFRTRLCIPCDENSYPNQGPRKSLGGVRTAHPTTDR